MKTRKFIRAALIGVSIAAFMAGAASAKTLVYCSEGSPEGFDPALYTSGTTFDASSRQVYNKLVEFERGTTTIGKKCFRSAPHERQRLSRWHSAALGNVYP